MSNHHSSTAKGAPAASVVQAWLSRQVAEVRRLDPHVRASRPDALHEMRVALRRLRSGLATYRPLFDRDSIEPLRAELAWLAQSLGGARDVEVTDARMREALGALEPGTLRGPVLDRLDVDLRERATRAHDATRDALRSDRYSSLVVSLEGLAADPPFTDRAGAPAVEALPARVLQDWMRLRRRVSAVEAADPAERAPLLHEARKAAKRLRYGTEPLVGPFGKDARRFVKVVKRVQSTLGKHQDSTVARAYLAEQADLAAGADEDTFTYGVLYARELAAGEQAEARFRRAWLKASRPTLHRWLH